MLMKNISKAVLTRNATGNSRCHVLASRALNMSGYFDQSVRSIESRSVVILINVRFVLAQAKNN